MENNTTTQLQDLAKLVEETFEPDEKFIYAIRSDDGAHSNLIEEFSNPEDALKAYFKELALGSRPDEGVEAIELTIENDDYCDTFLSEDWGFDWP